MVVKSVDHKQRVEFCSVRPAEQLILKQLNTSVLGDLRMLAQVPARTWKVFGICLIGVTFANLDHSLFTFVLTEISEK
ncbi:uncharacterized protein METZ01_LOCUS257031, partial [marine metagenome]